VGTKHPLLRCSYQAPSCTMPHAVQQVSAPPPPPPAASCKDAGLTTSTPGRAGCRSWRCRRSRRSTAGRRRSRAGWRTGTRRPPWWWRCGSAPAAGPASCFQSVTLSLGRCFGAAVEPAAGGAAQPLMHTLRLGRRRTCFTTRRRLPPFHSWLPELRSARRTTAAACPRASHNSVSAPRRCGRRA
jgi:hypothetical protein